MQATASAGSEMEELSSCFSKLGGGLLKRSELEAISPPPYGSEPVPGKLDPSARMLLLDRYDNVLPVPFDTQYRLRSNPAGYAYINANLIDGGRYIATQAPTTFSMQDFWLMVLETKARSVFMLTRLEEGNKIKADIYFPSQTGQQMNFVLSEPADSVGVRGRTVGMIRVKCSAVAPVVSAHPPPPVTRYFDVTRTVFEGSGENNVTERLVDGPHSIAHVWYEGWPDAGVPSRAEDLVQLVQHRDAVGHKEKPVIVHCSAGVGRTGTWLLLRVALDRGMASGNPAAFCHLLEEMRFNGRRGLLSSYDQFQYAYEVLRALSPGPPKMISSRCDGKAAYFPCVYCGERSSVRCFHHGDWKAYCCEVCCAVHCKTLEL